MIFILCCCLVLVEWRSLKYQTYYFVDFHDSFCYQSEFDVCYEMQRLVSEVTFPSFEGYEAFFDENSFSNDEDFADDKKTSCSLTIVSAFCFSSLIFASRTSK